MKLPSSSSLIFATLAVSSSSSSLAAPTSDVPPSAGGISASTSHKNVRSPMHDQLSMSRRAEQDQQGVTAKASNMICDTADKVMHMASSLVSGTPLDGILVGLTGPIIGAAMGANCGNGVKAALTISRIEDPQGGSQESASARSFDPSQSEGPSTPPPSPELSSESHLSSPPSRRDSAHLPVEPPVEPPVDPSDLPVQQQPAGPSHLPMQLPVDPSSPSAQPPVVPSRLPVQQPIVPPQLPVNPAVDPAHLTVTPSKPPIDPPRPPVQLPVKSPVETPVKAAGEDMPTSSSSSAQGRATPVEPPVKPPVKDSSPPAELPVSPPTQQKNIRRGIHPVRTTKQTAGKVKNNTSLPVGKKNGARDSADTSTGPQRRSRLQARSDSKVEPPVSPDNAPSPAGVADHAPVKPPVPSKHRHHHSSSETATSTAKETFTDTAKHGAHTHASS